MLVPFDLLIRNGHIIDPAQNINGIADVGIREGRIQAIGPALDATGCKDIRDASGTYVCPGLVDLHGHWYEGGLYGINAEIGLNHGVTTAVDAGTSGFANFPEFRRTAIETSRARILAFVHVSFMGLHGPFAEELIDLRYARPTETAIVAAGNRDVAVGVKVRLGAMTASHGNDALDLTLEAAREAEMPVMAHVSAGADEHYVLDHLRPRRHSYPLFSRAHQPDGCGHARRLHPRVETGAGTGSYLRHRTRLWKFFLGDGATRI